MNNRFICRDVGKLEKLPPEPGWRQNKLGDAVDMDRSVQRLEDPVAQT